MSTVTISSKYQIVIPQEVRESLNLRPGQRLTFFTVNGQIRLVPVKPLRQYRGMFKAKVK